MDYVKLAQDALATRYYAGLITGCRIANSRTRQQLQLCRCSCGCVTSTHHHSEVQHAWAAVEAGQLGTLQGQAG
jgi:hypothetical protein